MRQHYESTKLDQAITTLTSVAGVVVFISIVILFVSQVFHKLVTCCRELLRKDSKYEEDLNRNIFKERKKVIPTPARSRASTTSVLEVPKYGQAAFEIPGHIRWDAIQPLRYSSASSSTSSLNEPLLPPMNNAFSFEYLQPRERASSFSYKSSRKFSCGSSAADSVLLELYESSVEEGINLSGRIRLNLQYEDPSKQKLLVHVTDAQNLALDRNQISAEKIFVSAVLLPERTLVVKGDVHELASNVELQDTLVFISKPHNRDFESRILHISLTFVNTDQKEQLYGETRIALLDYEIYSQVPTSVSANIKFPVAKTELGDAHILVSYSPEEKKLNVRVKATKYIENALSKLKGFHIKVVLEGAKENKRTKQTLTRKLSEHKYSNTIELHGFNVSFELDPERLTFCNLKLSFYGHSRLRKHLSLGKTRIGYDSDDCGGRAHWEAVVNYQGVGWTMWHTIYGGKPRLDSFPVKY